MRLYPTEQSYQRVIVSSGKAVAGMRYFTCNLFVKCCC